MTFEVRCWSCGTVLIVPHDRRNRDAKTAGENTIDPTIRVCSRCWKEIKRRCVSEMSRCVTAGMR